METVHSTEFEDENKIAKLHVYWVARIEAMEDSAILRVTTYLEELSNVRFDHFPGLILQGLQVIHVGKGFVQCKLIITDPCFGNFFH